MVLIYGAALVAAVANPLTKRRGHVGIEPLGRFEFFHRRLEVRNEALGSLHSCQSFAPACTTAEQGTQRTGETPGFEMELDGLFSSTPAKRATCSMWRWRPCESEQLPGAQVGLGGLES